MAFLVKLKFSTLSSVGVVNLKGVVSSKNYAVASLEKCKTCILDVNVIILHQLNLRDILDLFGGKISFGGLLQCTSGVVGALVPADKRALLFPCWIEMPP